MSEPIEFPLNFERFMEMGQSALTDERYDEAFVNFEAAYNLQEDIRANSQLVKLLMARSEYLDAKKMADEMGGRYLEEEEYLQLYLNVLVGNHEFIKGRKLILKSRVAQNSTEKLLEMIEKGEHYLITFQQKERTKRRQVLSHFETASFYQQAQKLQQLERLPLVDYLELAKTLIKTPACHILLRQSLLESLVELEREEEVVILTIAGEERSVLLSELTSISTQSSYQKSQAILLKILEKQDSELTRDLQEELRLQFTMLYPWADELIEAPDLWVQLFLTDYLGMTFKEQQVDVVTKDRYLQLQGIIKEHSLKMTI